MEERLNNSIILSILLILILIMNCTNDSNNIDETKDMSIPILKCKEKDIFVLKSIASDAEISLKKLMVYDDAEYFCGDYSNEKNGIFFNSNGDITALRLKNTKFSNLKLLSTLIELECIDLSNNRILKIEGLDNLHKLKILYLIENKISKIESLDNLRKLEVLNLSKNEISRIEGLENLHSLENLDLAVNQIRGIVSLKGLNKLKILFIYSNNIDVIDFNGSKDLRWVMASFNNISEIRNIKRSSKLGDLDIYGNPIYDIEGIESLKRLKEVCIGGYIGGDINGYTGNGFSDREYFDDDRADLFIKKLEKMKVEVIKSPHGSIGPAPGIFK